MSGMGKWIGAIIFSLVVIKDIEGCLLIFLQTIDWDGVSLNGSSNIVVEVSKMNTWECCTIWNTFEFKFA